jgi:hypothetical protein
MPASTGQVEMSGAAFVPACVKVHDSGPPACCGPHSISNCQNSSLAELSDCSMGPRLRARRLTSAGDRRQARRLNATGFAFAVVGRGELLMLLLFKAMLLLERAGG